MMDSAKRRGSDTRAALIQAAERLFAQRGLAGVSARDITREAGARNQSALHYHFGDMEALLKEIFADRYQQIEKARLAYIQRMDHEHPDPSVQTLLEVAIAPLFEACLEENGRLYAFFCHQFSSDPRFNMTALIEEFELSSVMLIGERLTAKLAEVPRAILEARLRQVFTLSVQLMADYARRIEAGEEPALEQATREAAASLTGFLQTLPPTR